MIIFNIGGNGPSKPPPTSPMQKKPKPKKK